MKKLLQRVSTAWQCDAAGDLFVRHQGYMLAGSHPSSVTYLNRYGIKASKVRPPRQAFQQMNGSKHDRAVHKDIHKILFTEEQIRAKTLEVGR